MEKETGSLFSALFTFSVSAFVGGLVFSILWGWFIVPFGIMEITVPHAIGIGAMASMVTYQYTDKRYNVWKLMYYSITMSMFMLIVGFVANLFM